MITPTIRAILLLWLGAPVAMAAALAAPAAWSLGVAWIGVVGLLVLADAMLGADRRRLEIRHDAPRSLPTVSENPLELTIAFTGRAAPRVVELALETNERLKSSPGRIMAVVHDGAARARFTIVPERRGEAKLERLWLRWRGPLGLAAKQRVEPLDHAISVTPDTRSVIREAIRIFSRNALFGQKVQIDRGDGSEFDSLREFSTGMDRRSIDWKHSAKHRMLLAKEYRTERNHTVMFALDTGRVMSEPVNGAARIDQAINASLLLAYVSLKLGDRVGFFGFDARPKLATGAVAGATSYPLLQHLTAALDYSTEETNYTLGLTTLAAQLDRRSLVVVFTEFADSTSAELMIENVTRLTKRHLVLFVAFRDEELESLARAEPQEPDDVSRAVIAASLLKERELVIARLQRLGVEIVDAPASLVGPELLNRYFQIKRRERL
jgi:uncharacterized protein (DUF58 family)